MRRHLPITLLATTLLLAFAGAAAAQPTTPPRPADTATPTTPPVRRMPPASGSLRPRPAPARESLGAVRDRGVLRACVSPYMPWVIAGPDGQAPSGFAVDVARQLAHDMGVELQLVHTNYRDLIADLFEVNATSSRAASRRRRSARCSCTSRSRSPSTTCASWAR